MAVLGWNEIRANAMQFSRDWEKAYKENAEAQTFWNEFLQVFGVNRRVVNAVFEESVKSIEETAHRIDLFCKGRFLAEHKSLGADLDKAKSQAFEYILDLEREGRQKEIPRFIAVSDFARIVLYDLEPDDQGELFRGITVSHIEIHLPDLHKHVAHFGFLIGQHKHRFGEEDPANIEAAEIMASLHDTIAAGGYPPKDLERLMVRLLFCMFAEDTGIFDTGLFQLYIENYTHETGSDLGGQLGQLFQTLNRHESNRGTNLHEALAEFPYINGELFAETLELSAFNRDMRNALIAACRFDWSKISPAIFGSLFQGIMDDKERRQIGAHYTSERDILKVIRPLFLDELQAEFKHIQIFKNKATRDSRLREFQKKLAGLNMLDPACGCGNFLVIAYRELRQLELAVLKVLHPVEGTTEFSLGEVTSMAQVDVSQFYGIEIGEWAARIAETALWLTDHQMNIELSTTFGNNFQRIPLKASPHIRCDNALRIDWNDVLPAEDCSYVFGNPPFIGHHYQSMEQKKDHAVVLKNVKARGVLDYVCNWYIRAAEFIDGSKIQCALVSTNSISQGEQVGLLWTELLGRHRIKIHFAHRTFTWQSEARGKAHVHVVIVGFGQFDVARKRLFDYSDIKGEPQETVATNINPYLIEAPDLVITPDFPYGRRIFR